MTRGKRLGFGVQTPNVYSSAAEKEQRVVASHFSPLALLTHDTDPQQRCCRCWRWWCWLQAMTMTTVTKRVSPSSVHTGHSHDAQSDLIAHALHLRGAHSAPGVVGSRGDTCVITHA